MKLSKAPAMRLVLALEASSPTYAVAVGAAEQPRAQLASRRDDPGYAGWGDLVARTMAAAGATFTDVGMLALGVGPGGLTSIRSAVAYANGLAFSLGVPIFPVSSLELMAIAAQRDHHGPFLCLKRGQGGNVYGGLMRDGEMTAMRHGTPDYVLSALVGDLGQICVAGAAHDDVAPLLPGVTVVDAGIAEADVLVLYQAGLAASAGSDRLVQVASPINEASRLLYENAASSSPRQT
jgi:tRNA threonylcarbamoyl adenosine modification protein YeaZ